VPPTWILVWFIIGICSTLALIGLVLFLGWHGVLLGRTFQRLGDEIRPLADDISRATDRQSRRLDELRTKAAGLRFGKSRR
jgi:hypothetical protein